MRSDVPVGLFLSGGIDSGLVAALAGSAGCSSPLALTVGVDEKNWDETSLAQATAQAVGLEHRIVHAPPTSLELVDTLAWFYDEPFGDSSALPSYLVCQAGKPFATVFLTGDGGDEAFAGYGRYIASRRQAWIGIFLCLFAQPFGLYPISRRFFPGSRPQLLKTSLPDFGYAAFYTLPFDPVLNYILHPDLRSWVSQAGQRGWSVWQASRSCDLTHAPANSRLCYLSS